MAFFEALLREWGGDAELNALAVVLVSTFFISLFWAFRLRKATAEIESPEEEGTEITESEARELQEGRSCNVCGKRTSLKRCGGCHSTWYCSATHQKQDWSEHGRICNHKRRSGKTTDAGATDHTTNIRAAIPLAEDDSSDNQAPAGRGQLQPPEASPSAASAAVEEPSHDTPGRACAVCSSTERLRRCQRCHSVWYCGQEHQKSHWKQSHRTECRPQNIAVPQMQRVNVDIFELFETALHHFQQITPLPFGANAKFYTPSSLIDDVLFLRRSTDEYPTYAGLGKTKYVHSPEEPHLFDYFRALLFCRTYVPTTATAVVAELLSRGSHNLVLRDVVVADLAIVRVEPLPCPEVAFIEVGPIEGGSQLERVAAALAAGSEISLGSETKRVFGSGEETTTQWPSIVRRTHRAPRKKTAETHEVTDAMGLQLSLADGTVCLLQIEIGKSGLTISCQETTESTRVVAPRRDIMMFLGFGQSEARRKKTDTLIRENAMLLNQTLQNVMPTFPVLQGTDFVQQMLIPLASNLDPSTTQEDN
eukprot:TRINITY_DN9036_c0_g1_i1.p1 TRINITY_DN9036_c0_g1~~TRINITY_DN9036_c0_g1_i1.p1  ORF type:complete len:535 (+),score=84.91 TRINITY_DN9036_c0_g1_i1:20-1624(+)